VTDNSYLRWDHQPPVTEGPTDVQHELIVLPRLTGERLDAELEVSRKSLVG
jgi:hypothetical protein